MSKKYSPTQHIGFKAEKKACQFLRRKGLRLITTNFKSHYGEIDLIMENASTLVFVEVRYRASKDRGYCAESVNKTKQGKLIKTAQIFLQQYCTIKSCRFDVVAIHQTNIDDEIDWIKDAFQVQ